MTARASSAMWFAALALWIATPTLSHAQLLRADLQVNGMTCPFCAFGIEKKLRAVEGVEEVDILLDEGEVRLTLASGNSCTVDAFENAVSRAGFEIAGLRLEVQGTVAVQGGDSVLEASHAGRFRLLERANGRLKPISDASLKRLLDSGTDGAVVVNGGVDGDRDGVRDLVLDGPNAASAGSG